MKLFLIRTILTSKNNQVINDMQLKSFEEKDGIHFCRHDGQHRRHYELPCRISDFSETIKFAVPYAHSARGELKENFT